MAQTYANEVAAVLSGTTYTKGQGQTAGAKLKRIRATIPYDGQASGDTIVLGTLPAGAVFAYGVLTASATAGASATIAIGTTESGEAAAFRAAATFTNADTPTLFGKAAETSAAPAEGNRTLIATIGTASLPDSANYCVVDIYYSDLA